MPPLTCYNSDAMLRPSLHSEAPLQSLNSATDTFKRAAWNIAVGTAIIVGTLYLVFNVAPGIIPPVVR